MKKNLPEINTDTLETIFKYVYSGFMSKDYEIEEKYEEIIDLITVLKSMQIYNYKQRNDDTRELFFQLNNIISFEINSEETTLWLSLALAIKELYGIPNTKFNNLIKKLVRKK